MLGMLVLKKEISRDMGASCMQDRKNNVLWISISLAHRSGISIFAYAACAVRLGAYRRRGLGRNLPIFALLPRRALIARHQKRRMYVRDW